MKVLGLDISSNSTGWAVLENDTVMDYGILTTEGEGAAKLVDFYSQLVNILEGYSGIQWVGIEDVYVQNAVTTKILSRYHGVAMAVAANKYGISNILLKKQYDSLLKRKDSPRARPNIPDKAFYLPTPGEVFKIMGVSHPKDRNRKKQEAIDWVHDNLYIDLDFEENDIADAICIAFAIRMLATKLLG